MYWEVQRFERILITTGFMLVASIMLAVLVKIPAGGVSRDVASKKGNAYSMGPPTRAANDFDYVADFSTGNWQSTDYSYISTSWQTVAQSTYTTQGLASPRGACSQVLTCLGGGGYPSQTYIDLGLMNTPFLQSNATYNLKAYCYGFTLPNPQGVSLYSTTSFNQNTIDWANQPALGQQLWEGFPQGYGFTSFSCESSEYVAFAIPLAWSPSYLYVNFDQLQSSFEISKFYHAAGTLFAQTDVPEQIKLTSPTYSLTTLP